MTDPTAFVIPRHAVRADPATGLSPLQRIMVGDPHLVRILSAPTGTGKSYAFQWAMRETGARVLFVVPTRRLAQNLAEGLVADLVRDGIEEAEARRRVPLWTSDERARQEAESPETRVRDRRLRNIRAEKDGRGQMIIATPESVALHVLSAQRRSDGLDPERIDDLLRFDHVVFDEFHTIEARGMGLSCAIATLALRFRDTARVTFLSATPIDVRTTLMALGIPEEAILIAAEEVTTGTAAETPGLRALHGDVRVRIEGGDGLLEALDRHRDLFTSTLERTDGGHQVVLVYDSVSQLLTDKAALAAWLDGVGVTADERLVINSADDSVTFGSDGRFTMGREAKPGEYRVLVATSSIELGVTFRAGLMIMEPGHDACSFVQRIGRVARGDLPGDVVVLAISAKLARDAWLRLLLQVLPKEGGIIPIDRLVELVLGSLRGRFYATAEELAQDAGVFRRMPQSAVWCAGLFWAALERSAHYKGTRTVRDFAPRQAKILGGWIASLEHGSPSACRWAAAALAEAKRLRMILPKVRLIDPWGEAKSYPWTLYDGTPWLVRMPSRTTDNGEIEVLIDIPLNEAEARFGGRRATRYEEALMPHLRNTRTLELRGIREAWMRCLDADLDAIDLRPEARKAIETAQRIVKCTGIVPTADTPVLAADSVAIA